MATVPQNLQVKSIPDVTQLPNIAGNVIHSGDAVYVDQTTYDIKALATDAQAVTFAGFSIDTYDPTNYGVYANDPVPPNGMNVQREGRWFPYTTSGETYNPGIPVYIGSDAQHITAFTASSTQVLGWVADLPDASQKAYVGTGSNQIQIDIHAKWPSNII